MSSSNKSTITNSLVFMIKALHYVISLVLFFVFWMLFKYETVFIEFRLRFRYNYFVLALYALLLLFFIEVYNAYYLGYVPLKRLLFYQILSQLLSVTIVYVVVSTAWARLYNPVMLLILLVLQFLLNLVWTNVANRLYIKLHRTRDTVLVYGNKLDKLFYKVLLGKPSEKLYHVTKTVEYDGDNFKEIKSAVEKYEAIFAIGVHLHCRNDLMKYCKERGIPLFFLPTVGDVIVKDSHHLKSFDAPVFFVSRSHPNPGYAFVKRSFDILASGLGLLILSTILLVTGLAIHFYDGGPAFYKQTRLTKDEKEFKIFKFRSMRVDAEKIGGVQFSTGENDPRVTPIGRFIRKIRFDELPQLWNIFKGDMSFVGPRPERPEFAEKFYEYLPEFKLRLQSKAGLTGYAQVYGRYNSDPYEKLIFDLLYINNMNIKNDIMLIFATIAILFSSNSTKGYDNGQGNAKVDEETQKKFAVKNEDEI